MSESNITIKVMLDRHIDKGDSFNDGIGNDWEVLGWYTGKIGQYYMTAKQTNDPADLEYLSLWKMIPQHEVNHSAYYTSYELVHFSNRTVLDAALDSFQKEGMI